MKALIRLLDITRNLIIATASTFVIVAGGVYAMATIKTPSYLLVALFLLCIFLSNILAKTASGMF